MIYIVTGTARCGSTLAVRMLQAGGLDGGMAEAPFMEDPRATKSLPNDYQWLKEYDGKVLKLLVPQHFVTKEMFEELGLEPKVLYTWRVYKAEQVKSFRKLLEHTKSDVWDQKSDADAAGFIEEQEVGVQEWIKETVGENYFNLPFEKALRTPQLTALRMEQWVQPNKFDVDAAAKVVVPRGPECLDYMLEERL